jgi:o-succinylbenzoate---CoA ligase
MKNRAFATFGMTETISHIALKRLNGTHPDNAFRILPGIKISQDDRKCLVVEAPDLGVRHLQTNDVVHIQSATEFEWLGRKDNVINSGGLKIFPEQIEAKLKPILDIPFFITAVPNSQSGQQVAIAIEKEKLTLQEANALKSRFHTLGKLQSPKAILAIPVFERTDNGKIKRKESLRKIAMKIAL